MTKVDLIKGVTHLVLVVGDVQQLAHVCQRLLCLLQNELVRIGARAAPDGMSSLWLAVPCIAMQA